jgi:hypothetical protein
MMTEQELQSLRNLGNEAEAADDEIARLRADLAEEDAIRERLAQLCAGAIVAIRGPEPKLTRWGYHDLPERVAAIVAERDALAKRVKELECQIDAANRPR